MVTHGNSTSFLTFKFSFNLFNSLITFPIYIFCTWWFFVVFQSFVFFPNGMLIVLYYIYIFLYKTLYFKTQIQKEIEICNRFKAHQALEHKVSNQYQQLELATIQIPIMVQKLRAVTVLHTQLVMTILTQFSTKELEFLKNDHKTQKLLNY